MDIENKFKELFALANIDSKTKFQQIEMAIEKTLSTLDSINKLINLSLKFSNRWQALFVSSEFAKAVPIIGLVLGLLLASLALKKLIANPEKSWIDIAEIGFLIVGAVIAITSTFLAGSVAGIALVIISSSLSVLSSLVKLARKINDFNNETDADKKVGYAQAVIGELSTLLTTSLSLTLAISVVAPIAWPVTLAIAAILTAIVVLNMVWRLAPQEKKQSLKALLGLGKTTYGIDSLENDETKNELNNKELQSTVTTENPSEEKGSPLQTKNDINVEVRHSIEDRDSVEENRPQKEPKSHTSSAWVKAKPSTTSNNVKVGQFFTKHMSKEKFKQIKDVYQKSVFNESSEYSNLGERLSM